MAAPPSGGDVKFNIQVYVKFRLRRCFPDRASPGRSATGKYPSEAAGKYPSERVAWPVRPRGDISHRAGCPAGQASRGNYTSCGLPGPPRLAGKYPIERVARSAKPRGDISHRAGYSVGQASRGNFTSSGSPGRPRLAGKFPIERVARPARPRGDISHRAGCPVRQGSRGYFASCGLLGRPRLVGIFHMSSRTGALGRSRGNLAFDGSSAFRSILVVCAGIFCVGCSVGLALPIWSTSG